MEDIVVSAPGKVILHGEHSVVYGKAAVASSLNLRCFLRGTVGEDDAVILDLPDIDIHHSWTVKSVQSQLLPSLNFSADGNGSVSAPSEKCVQQLKQFAGIDQDSTDTRHLAVVSFLYLYCSICAQEERSDAESRFIPPLHLRLISQLPVGAGLGSSAAFSVCLSALLLQLAKRTKMADQNVASDKGDGNHDNQLQHVLSDKDKERINRWAFVGEQIIHGRPSGIDNSVSTFGGAIHFQNKVITPIQNMPTLKILLTNTKVPRSTKTLVASARQRYDKLPEVMGPVLEAMDGAAEKSIKIYRALYQQPTSQPVFSELETLIDMNQHLLNTIGAGHASLDTVVQVTAGHGLHTKLTGAGGGGCAYTLLTPDTTEEVMEAVCKDLHDKGFDCWETSIGASGVCLHPNPANDLCVPGSLFQ